MNWKYLFFSSASLDTQNGESTTELKIYLPTDVRYVSEVQLIAFQVKGLAPGVYPLVLKEMSAGVNAVLSNDPEFSNIFYPLLVSSSQTTNTIETSGLISHKFAPHNMPTMTLQIFDANTESSTPVKLGLDGMVVKHAHFLLRVCHDC